MSHRNQKHEKRTHTVWVLHSLTAKSSELVINQKQSHHKELQRIRLLQLLLLLKKKVETLISCASINLSD